MRVGRRDKKGRSASSDASSRQEPGASMFIHPQPMPAAAFFGLVAGLGLGAYAATWARSLPEAVIIHSVAGVVAFLAAVSTGDLRWAVVVAVGLSGIVLPEPAPTDVLFALSLICWAIMTIREVQKRRSWSEKLTVTLQYFDKWKIRCLVFISVFVIAHLTSYISSGSSSPRFTMISLYLISSFLLILLLEWHKQLISRIMILYVVSVALNLLPLWNDATWIDGRYKGWFKDPNVLAAYIVPALLIIFTQYVTKVRICIRYSILAVPLLIILLVITASRGALLNILAASGMFAVLLLRTKNIRIFLVLCSTIFVVALSIFLLRFDANLDNVFFDKGRWNTYVIGINMIRENGLLGVGPGSFEHYAELYAPRGLSRSQYSLAAHNTYIRIIAELGILGFIGFIGFTVITLLKCCRLAYSPNAWMRYVGITSLTALCGILAQSLIIDTIHWRHFWLWCAIPYMVGDGKDEDIARI